MSLSASLESKVLARLSCFTSGLFVLAIVVPRPVYAQDCTGYVGYAGIYANWFPTVPEYTNGHVVQFTVTNVASEDPFCQAPMDLAAYGGGNVSIVSVNPSTVWVYPGFGYSVTVDVTYNVGGAGSGLIWLERSPYEGNPNTCDECGSATITVIPAEAAVISLVDYHEGLRDVSKCVANCLDAVASHSTAPYYSNDTPRSVQLIYRSSLAVPQVFLNIAAWDTSAAHPTRMSVRLERVGGGPVTFLNDSSEFFFACPSAGPYWACDSTTNRLAVQFNASANGISNTGAYWFNLFVRSHRSGSPAWIETQRRIRVLVQLDPGVPFGVGWMLGGYQRLYAAGDSLVITDGQGGIGFFPRWSQSGCSPCNYSSPEGDFSAVRSGYEEDHGAVAVYFRRYPDGTEVAFNSTGRTVWIKDRNNAKVYFWHNASNVPYIIEDPVFKRDSLFYAGGLLTAIKDPGGRRDSVFYDNYARVIRIKDAAGGLAFQGTYDSSGRLLQRTDRRGGVWGYAYDHVGKLRADTSPMVKTNHGPAERPVVRFTSLESTMIPSPGSDSGSSNTPAALGDSRTLRARVTTPRGHTTAYAFNRFGQALRVEAPLGRTSRHTIDTWGRHLVDSVPGGTGHHVVRFTWSGPNLTQQKDSVIGQSGGRTINYAYDGTYNLLTTVWGDTDSLVNVLNSAKNRIDSTKRGGSTVWTKIVYGMSPYEYAECSKAGPTNLGLTHRVSCRFRVPGGFRNTGSTIDSLSQPMFPHYHTLTTFPQDSLGRVTHTINAAGDSSGTARDPINRVTATWGPRKDTTKYKYGDSLFVTEITDALGGIHRFWPNAYGKPDSVESPGPEAASLRRSYFIYDSSGNLVSHTNRRDQTVTFTYDSLDQLRTRVVGTGTTQYFNDPLGRFTWVANSESVDTVYRDSLGRADTVVSCRVLAGTSRCFRIRSTYETNSNLRDKIIVWADVWGTAKDTARFFYSNQMLLDSIINFTGQKQTFRYGAERTDSVRKFKAMARAMTWSHYRYSPWDLGQARLFFSDTTLVTEDTALTRQIGSAYSYDTLRRVVRHHHGPMTRPDSVRSIVYGKGRLSTKSDTAVFSWGSGGGCDTLGHLGQTCYYGSGGSRGEVLNAFKSFYYDTLGNRRDSATQAYQADPGNRLRRFANYRMNYDIDGNLVFKRTLKPSDTTVTLVRDSLYWSATGLLGILVRRDSLWNQTLKITWGYDGHGRMVRQTVVGGTTTRFIWDGNDLLYKLDDSGAPITYWTYYPGTGKPQSVGFVTGGVDSTLYYITDGLHNTAALLKAHNNSYQVYGEFRYGPFGDSLGATGAGVNIAHFRFKGAYYDGLTRYYRMGARLYDPDVGRFVTEDAAGFVDGMNLYTFAGNDPVNGYDPTGTISIGKLLNVLGPIAAFVITAAVAPGTAPEAFLAATKSMAATAGGAAVSAGVESLFTGQPFMDAFYRNFTLSSLSKVFQTTLALTRGGGVTGVGANSWVQGTVTSANPIPWGGKPKFGLALGSSAGLWGPSAPILHELGHTLQFIGLSALTPLWNRWVPYGPWIPYAALGYAGPKWWENMADVMGAAVQ